MIISLTIITFLTIACGIAYAKFIYDKPFSSKMTWVSVVIGDGMTDLFMMTMTTAILYHSDYLSSLWFVIPIPVFCHIFTGLPMIIGQVYKSYQQIKEYANIKNGIAH